MIINEKKKKWFKKQVFITGICGTVGKQVLSLLNNNVDIEIIGIDNNESELSFIR